MLQSWRWFGPEDYIPLDHVRQAGASGIVTALHHIYDGRAWTDADIAARMALITAAGLRWDVCESIPMHTSLKLRSGPWRRYLDQWKDSLAALGRAGVPVVCYNFMPVVDWTRTNLRYPMPSTGLALRFDKPDFVGYDVFVLKRPHAADDYEPALVSLAHQRINAMSPTVVDELERNIIAGLPGGEDSYSRAGILERIALFDDIDSEGMRANLFEFLSEVVPVAEDVGVRLAIHPDDPPFPLFGLPRVVSTVDDVRKLLGAVDRPANGLTFCAGSYGSRADNDVLAMASEFAARIHFVHLRNVTTEADGSFIEDDHLGGGVDMVALIRILMAEERRRRSEGRMDAQIPMRPDHGHLLADDLTKKTNPGYSLIGRLKGLAELRGVMSAVAAIEGN